MYLEQLGLSGHLLLEDGLVQEGLLVLILRLRPHVPLCLLDFKELLGIELVLYLFCPKHLLDLVHDHLGGRGYAFLLLSFVLIGWHKLGVSL